MADQTLSAQATRRDDSTFRGQVSAALDLEILDIVRSAGAWAGEDGEKASGYARSLLGSSTGRAEAIDACARIAAADLIAEVAPTDTKIRKAVRRALRFAVKLSQEA